MSLKEKVGQRSTLYMLMHQCKFLCKLNWQLDCKHRSKYKDSRLNDL